MALKGKTILLGMGLLLAAGAFVHAADNYQVVNGPKEFYFGHISLVDIKNDGKDAVVQREGLSKPELAVLNTPIGPGDTIRTDARRVEIQLDNGTILRLDADSELKVETILARSLSSSRKLSNMLLRKGQVYAMYKQFSAKETFQIMTTTAAVKLKMDTVAMIERAEDGATSVQVRRGRAYVLYGPTQDNLKQQLVNKNERMTITPDHRFALQEYIAGSDFERWNEAINADFTALHEGQTPLPKPIYRLPRAVVDWAQKYGNMNGEWLWDDYVGYVWRPYYNDRYPSGNWMPYYYGNWSRVGNQMFWVPGESWGWVPYHLGVWHWMKSKGWVWIPGSAFAPAWVDWGFTYGGLYAWRPWSLYDWMWWDPWMSGFGGYGSYWGSPFYSWGYGSSYWGGNYGYYGYSGSYRGIDPTGGLLPSKPVLDKVSKDQLQRPAAPFGMPKELYKGYKALMVGLKKGDSSVIESLQTQAKAGALVRSDQLNSPRVHEHAVSVKAFLAAAEPMRNAPALNAVFEAPRPSTSDAARFASRTYGRNLDAVPAEAGRVSAGRIMPRAVTNNTPQPSMRIRDWNPDVSLAQRIGVNIRYNSRSNEVYSPELNIRSRDTGRFSRMSGSSVSASSDGGSGSVGSSGGVSSGGSVSSSGGSASGSSSGTSTSTSGGGGHIKSNDSARDSSSRNSRPKAVASSSFDMSSPLSIASLIDRNAIGSVSSGGGAASGLSVSASVSAGGPVGGAGSASGTSTSAERDEKRVKH